MESQRITYRAHAIQHMFERQIAEADVVRVLATGEVIEDYPDDFPYPSRLIMGWSGGRPIHVVAADNRAANETIVVTAYEPDDVEWQAGFKRRR